MNKGHTMYYMARPPRTWEREDTGINSKYLRDILAMHVAGMTSVEIGLKKKKDHSTILYHLRKLGVPRGLGRGYRPTVHVTVVAVQRVPTAPPVKRSPYDDLFLEPVNPGKPYKEYLKKAGKTKGQIKRILAHKANAARWGGDIATIIVD